MTEKKEILRVEHLDVTMKNGSTGIPVLRDVSFVVREGERWAIAGESGAGKSMTMNALAALLPDGSTKLSGRILFRFPDGSWQDLLALPYKERRRFLTEKIAIIFQDSINALNPNERIRKQWSETVRLHQPDISAGDLEAHLLGRMEIFGVRGGTETLQKYPDQLSGGMRQRIAIAMALESRAQILIADEPTTSLDAITQRSTIEFIRELLDRRQWTLLFISHNLGLLQSMCDHIIIMKDGSIVEQGTTEELFYHGKEEYTRQLVRETMKIMGEREVRHE
jgi:ABC-type dipeptide/oligopeptide/nickel transport system ATPase component